MPTESHTRYPEERRLATVLFADVQGFTTLAEHLDFETVSDLIKGIWQRLDKAIESHNGYIDKHLGDGVMAVWGAPVAGDNDAEEAVATGLDLIRALNEFCQYTAIPGAHALKLRVGINSGLVFAGYVGTRNEYTVIGDTVNVAARLQQGGEADSVTIGENTFKLVRGVFRVRALEPTKIKGKAELIQPYAVEGRLTAPGRIRYQGADSLSKKMVGRSDEIEKLGEQYRRAFEADAPVMVLLSGDVGIGKSRLLMEFGKALEATGDAVNILSTRSPAHASRIPFYLWRILLRSRFGVSDTDPSATASEKWSRGMESFWEADTQKVEASQVLGAMTGLTSDENFVSDEHLQRVYSLTGGLLQRFSQRKRLVLLFDDLQWADRESLQLLSTLLTPREPFQMLIVGAARTEFLKNQPQWHNLSRVIPLSPLEFDPEMVREAYPDLRGLSHTALEEIALRTEGNPYFLEEIIKSLLKNGLPQADQGYAHLLLQIPESLRATLQARMDNLSREARVVALLASVVGRMFWVGAVLAAARSKPIPGATQIINIPESVIDRFIQDGLRQLVGAELVFPCRGSRYSENQEYVFKNSYLRDVAYSLIPNRSRAQYHTAVAEWLSQKTEASFQGLARSHEQRAAASVKSGTSDLSVSVLESREQ